MDSMFRIVTARELPELATLSDSIAEEVWPRFMLNDPVAAQFWHYLYQLWPDYQFGLYQADRLVAVGNSVPLHWDRALAELPEEGWDWILPKAVHDYNTAQSPNLQAAIQIMIPKELQGKGLSTHAVAFMKRLGMDHGHANLIVPTRPTRKCQYPHASMDEYVTWRDERDLPFDPWLRVHVRLGAQIVKVCHRSMQIKGTLEQWNQWTGIAFTAGGPHVVPGALVPVQVDVEKATAAYSEPNVWLCHCLVGERIG